MKHEIEFLPEEHLYIVDGIITPSVTQIMKKKFGGMYQGVSPKVLDNAATRGTNVHKAIEAFCTTGEMDGSKEVRNFNFLSEKFGFKAIGNEVPIVLEDEDKVVTAGTLDLILQFDDKLAIADIKTVSSINKDYLFYQLNLYKQGYEQTYGEEIQELYGIHLRDDKRKLIPIPVNWDTAREILYE